MKSKTSVILYYPVEEVFKAFIKLSKRDYNKLNEKNPLGCKYKKILKQQKGNIIRANIEVTGFELNELYQVTNEVMGDVFVTDYIFSEVDSETTRMTMVENQMVNTFMQKVIIFVQSMLKHGKLNAKLKATQMGIEEEIEFLRRKIEKNAKKEN